ncbi:predicted protein [Sclerotinia sclerotiorum 1980 UF-70]|uniref:Uncharacterized protein n=1 Tax=Sclerotinia sclerotiorum (strain ATCC 18683 / 1980 / Ss-1) TaxID=665079 RepID=A7E4F6_SCLS1|nr:predicted protein [Sclerotinia sclerotiorum 1980 UF-70]EDN90778.1 predicted protein [Sclerotinia sclerotiorum 1980 UF-70]
MSFRIPEPSICILVIGLAICNFSYAICSGLAGAACEISSSGKMNLFPRKLSFQSTHLVARGSGYKKKKQRLHVGTACLGVFSLSRIWTFQSAALELLNLQIFKRDLKYRHPKNNEVYVKYLHPELASEVGIGKVKSPTRF